MTNHFLFFETIILTFFNFFWRDIVSIINKKFPDFRSVMVEVQNYLETGSLICGSSNVTVKIKEDLYHMGLLNQQSHQK